MSNKNKALLTPFAECRTMRVTAAATQVHVKAVLQEAVLTPFHCNVSANSNHHFGSFHHSWDCLTERIQ